LTGLCTGVSAPDVYCHCITFSAIWTSNGSRTSTDQLILRRNRRFWKPLFLNFETAFAEPVAFTCSQLLRAYLFIPDDVYAFEGHVQTIFCSNLTSNSFRISANTLIGQRRKGGSYASLLSTTCVSRPFSGQLLRSGGMRVASLIAMEILLNNMPYAMVCSRATVLNGIFSIFLKIVRP